MTTSKDRVTIWLRNRQALDDLTEELRQASPIEGRSLISRSTVVEGCVALALADLRERGKNAAIVTQVTLLEGSTHDPISGRFVRRSPDA